MIRKKRENQKPVIDLTGPDGNAFALLGMAKRWFNKLEQNTLMVYDWSAIEKEAMSGDYDHLVATLEKYFGDYVIFEK